jgi:hypothetical protein
VVGYSHSTWLTKDASQVAGYELVEGLQLRGWWFDKLTTNG